MILNMEDLAQVCSFSAGSGQIDLELEDECPGLAEKVGGEQIVFLVGYCDSLVVISGKVLSYEKVEPDPDLPEQDVFARVSFTKTTSVAITWPEVI